MDGKMERKRLRLAEGKLLAQNLIGMTRNEGIARATEMGFDPQVIPSTAEAITADLRVNRVRVVVDEADRVVDAWAG